MWGEGVEKAFGPLFKFSSNSPLLGSTFEAHGVSRGQKSTMRVSSGLVLSPDLRAFKLRKLEGTGLAPDLQSLGRF